MQFPTQRKPIIEKSQSCLLSSSSTNRKIKLLKYQIDLDKQVAPVGQKKGVLIYFKLKCEKNKLNNYNPSQNIWHKLKKYGKIGQDFKKM